MDTTMGAGQAYPSSNLGLQPVGGQAMKPSALDEATQHLTRSIDVMTEKMAQLVQKLSPVLVDKAMNGGLNEKVPQPPRSRVVQNIESNSEKVELVTSTITYLINNCEV